MNLSPTSPSRRLFVIMSLLGLLGLGGFLTFYDSAFPQASLGLELSRAEILEKSRAFLLDMNYNLTDYRPVQVFYQRQGEVNYVERHLGLKEANQLFRDTVRVWRWKVRWFKELEEVEYTTEFSPDGALVGFWRKLPEKEPGEAPDEPTARASAEQFLTGRLHVDLSQYLYTERSTDQRPKRLDQSVVWRLSDLNISGAEYRISVSLQGVEVSGFSGWLRIPETWSREREEIGAKRDLLSNVNMTFTALALFFPILGFFIAGLAKRNIRWKAPLVIGGIAAFLIVTEMLNGYESQLFGYGTTESLGVFWSRFWLGLAMAGIGVLLFVLVFTASSTKLGREVFEGTPVRFLAMEGRFWKTREGLRSILLAYPLAFAFIGYIVCFYLLGRKVGVWVPVDSPIENILGTPFPSIPVIANSFMASLMEETIFRLFGIALVARFLKKEWLALLIPAILWGFGHTSYPQEPIWIRGLEVSLAGLAFGWFFMRYGLAVTLVAHYVVDAFLIGWPLLRAGHPTFVTHGLFAVSLGALPGLIALVALRKKREETLEEVAADAKAAPEPEAVQTAPEEPLPPVESLPTFDVLSAKKLWFAVAFAVAIFAIGKALPQWEFYGDPPDIPLTQAQAAKLAREALEKEGFKPDEGYMSFTTFGDKTTSIPQYLINRWGPERVMDTYLDRFKHRPIWHTEWVREKTVTTYSVTTNQEGTIEALKVKLPDTEEGLQLSEEEVVSQGWSFMESHRFLSPEKWEIIETKKKARPHRWDYFLTFREKNFDPDGLEHRGVLELSGNQITWIFLHGYYKVPDEWKRERSKQVKSWRNVVRDRAEAVMGVAFVFGVLILFCWCVYRGFLTKKEIWPAIITTVAFGLSPTIIGFVNEWPGFYKSYGSSTEQSLTLYTGKKLEDFASALLGDGVGNFVVVLVCLVFIRAFIPEGKNPLRLFSSLHWKRWGSACTFQAVALALGTILLLTGLNTIRWTFIDWVLPNEVTAHAQTSSADLYQYSEFIAVITSGLETLLKSAITILTLLTLFRRFLWKKTWVYGIMMLTFLISFNQESYSWAELGWRMTTGLLVMSVLFWWGVNILRWNFMAYALVIWASLGSIRPSHLFTGTLPTYGMSKIRFLSVTSPDLFSIGWQHMAARFFPFVLVLAVGLWQWKKARKSAEYAD